MYYIQVVSNENISYWNEYDNAPVDSLDSATRFNKWQDADELCQKLSLQFAGTLYFHRKKFSCI